MRLASFEPNLFHAGQRVACALSGGADSTALLLALLEANAEKNSLGVVLSAIHVHHGLRGAEADDDEAFVRELCARLGVPLTVERVDTPGRQAEECEGMEEAARELRYAAFRALFAEGRTDAIATAHTLDDQAETVVMKLLRGAWTEGLGGISPVLDVSYEPGSAGLPRSAQLAEPRFGVVRPMLAVRRAEVERFLRERHQPWREDSTNADVALTRNRVRHQLMPLLRTFNPASDEALARTATLAREDQAYWQAEVARVLPELVLPGKPVRGGGRAVSTGAGEQSSAIEVERLRAQPPALRRRLVRGAAAALGVRLGAEDTAKLLALAGFGGGAGPAMRPGARLDLGQGLRAERSLRELRLFREHRPAPGVRIPKKM